MSHDRVLVLGAGCIGMTTAIALLEQKVAKHVLVVADAFSPDLTTDQSVLVLLLF
jgi:glycine/D-amino acid oxidase-like deaminating enzyme